MFVLKTVTVLEAGCKGKKVCFSDVYSYPLQGSRLYCRNIIILNFMQLIRSLPNCFHVSFYLIKNIGS